MTIMKIKAIILAACSLQLIKTICSVIKADSHHSPTKANILIFQKKKTIKYQHRSNSRLRKKIHYSLKFKKQQATINSLINQRKWRKKKVNKTSKS